MPTVAFTSVLQRHVALPQIEVSGDTVGACLAAVFAGTPQGRGYVLDDQGRLRKHVIVFVNNEQIDDRVGLSDPVGPADEIYVMQALSGG